MNRKGLELIRQVDAISPQLASLLKKEELPPLFQKFIKHYRVGYGALFSEVIVPDEKTMDRHVLTVKTMYEDIEVEGEKYHAVLDYIFDYDRLSKELLKYHGREENWNKLGFVQIGLMHWDDVLLLGMTNENRDQIWRYGGGLAAKTHSKLEDDVFKFLSRLRESVDLEALEEWKISIGQIYRNLGEDFWRVRR